MTEPDTSATGANDELWLTYLNYDRAVQQAVNRLSALSSENVDEFRALLLKGRDRARIKDYEAESIRRLQGEAFVGDDELQRTLIVLNAENPRLGDELKRVVSTTGRPGDLDQTVAAIRAQQAAPQTSGQPKVDAPPRMLQAAPAVSESRPASDQAKTEEPRHRTRRPLSIVREPEQTSRSSWTKRLAISGAIVVVAGAGLAIVSSRLSTDDTAKTPTVRAATPPLRTTTEDRRTASTQAAQHPSTTIPAQVDTSSSGQTTNPAQPEKISPVKDEAPQPDASPASTPVPGARYKVVRGDMLTDIALRAYKDASKYILIQRANPSLRNGPDRIFYDQVIFIPPAP